MNTLLTIVDWLLLILFVVCVIGFFATLIRASAPSYQNPTRRDKTALIWAGLGIVFLASNFAFGELCYMNLTEPLVHEANNGNLPEVKRLIADGADVNRSEDEGDTTALVAAAAAGHADIVQYLLAHGADVNQKAGYFGRENISPLEAAKDHPNIVRLLRAAGAKE